MNTDLIIIKDYCDQCNVDPQFIGELRDDGLIKIEMVDDDECINVSQLNELERYKHLYYDLSINIAGIDAIHHMLEKILSMQDEILSLQNELSFFRR